MSSYEIDLKRDDDLLTVALNTPAFEKDKTVDYTCITYLTSKRKPDVYVGTEVLTAKQYRVKQINEKAEKSENKEEDSAASCDEMKQNYDDLKRQDTRYFAGSNITIKCYNCGEVGHISKNCPNELVIICFRCQQNGHSSSECPNIKCFKCNRIGHKSYECKVRSKDIVKCKSCNNIGHEEEDCLSEPLRIKKSLLKTKTCYFCKETGHVLCPYKSNPFTIKDYNSEEVSVSESEPESEDFDAVMSKVSKKKNKNLETTKKESRIFNKLSNRDIINTIFCPKCSGMHSEKECNVQLRYNSFDERRQIYSKSLFRNEKSRDDDRNYNKSSRNKYSKKNLYDDHLPSEESFTETIDKRRKKTRKEVYEEKDFKNSAMIKFEDFDEDSYGSQIENKFIQKQEESRERYLDSYEDDDFDDFDDENFKYNKKKRRDNSANYKNSYTHKNQNYNNRNTNGYFKQNNNSSWRNNNYSNRKSDMTFNKMVN